MDNMKSELYKNTTSLMDEVDYLRANNRETDLLDRATNLGNIAILYFESLSEMEIKGIVTIVNLSLSIVEDMKVGMPSQNEKLSILVEEFEELFRSKKFLLDGSLEKTVSIA